MVHFVKWSGPNQSAGAEKIGKKTQSTSVGGAFRFGIFDGSGVYVGPNDTSVASIAPRDMVVGSTNNITWFELVGRRESDVMIEARNRSDNGVVDYFQLDVKKNKSKARLPVNGINSKYHVDTTGIGPNWNASIVLNLQLAVTAIKGGTIVTDDKHVQYTAQWWSKSEFKAWKTKLKTLLEANWSEKFWLSSPSSLTDLEVSKPGGKARVNLHCVLKVSFVPLFMANHRIQVVKAGTTNGLAFRSNSSQFDDMDIQDVAPATSGFSQTFNTAIHEMGHILGLHHPFEGVASAPSQYCVPGHVDCNERMGLGLELRPKYATPWQNAAARWFSTDGHGHNYGPSDFPASMSRLAPVDV